jgi:hypothetical protein
MDLLVLRLISYIQGAVIVTTSGKPDRMKEQLETGALPDLTSEQVAAIQKGTLV